MEQGREPSDSNIMLWVSLSSTSRSAISPLIADWRILGESVAFRGRCPPISESGPLRIAM